LRVIVVVAVVAAAWAAGHWLGGRKTPLIPDSVVVDRVEPTRADAWASIDAHHGGAHAKTPAATGSSAAPLPAGPFGKNVAELRRRVDAGDAAAAMTLANGYRRCRFFTPSQNPRELEKRAEDKTVMQLGFYDQLVRKAKEKGVDTAKIPDVDAMQAYRGVLQAEVDLDTECRDADAGASKDWRAWLAKAAELGDVEARLEYWSEMVSQAKITPPDVLVRDKHDAANYLRDVLASGDWRALAATASVLEQGLYAEPDPFAAHAYYFAAAKAPTGHLDELPWLRGNGFLAGTFGNDTRMWLDARLRATAQSLTQDQRREAEQRGFDLYRRCCSGGAR